MVVVFECLRATAESRFLDRQREEGDGAAMFAKRYVEFEQNNKLIMTKYAPLVKSVSLEYSLHRSVDQR